MTTTALIPYPRQRYHCAGEPVSYDSGRLMTFSGNHGHFVAQAVSSGQWVIYSFHEIIGGRS